MTPYSSERFNDSPFSFISHIITISCGVVIFCVLSLAIIFSFDSDEVLIIEAVVTPPPIKVQVVAAGPLALLDNLSGDELKAMLHENNLWDIQANDVISPLVIPSYPANLDSLGIDDKKKIFLHALLPIALTANLEIDRERLRLFDILASSGALPGNFKLSDIPVGWMSILSKKDVDWLISLEDKYNAEDIKELKKRMRRVPVSLVMAQGALESSWGTSRFAQEGNNLFGLRTWGEKGITPEKKSAQSKYLVASYDSLLDSVHAYLLTLNSHRLYARFRDLRLSTQDPVVLSKGLIYYSEKRKEYISQVNRIIKYNSLKKFDTVQLQDKPSNSLIILSKN